MSFDANAAEAERVETALKVFTWSASKSEDIALADGYLRAVRSGDVLFGVATAIVQSGKGTAVSLQFVAAAVEEQIRVRWEQLGMADRVTAFQLATAIVGESAPKDYRVAIERGCAAAAVCVARLPAPERRSAWQAAMTAARRYNVPCEMLAALIEEWDAMSSGSADRDRERRMFAKEQCALAVAEASSVLSKAGSKPSEKNAAVRCLHRWRPHADRGALIDVLSTAVLDPALCEAAGEVLDEEVSDGELGASALVRMCEALRSMLTETGMNGIQAHVVAQTCTAAAEGNIDAMLRGNIADRVDAAATLVSTLLACLWSQSRSAFMAAVDGWAVLAASAAALRDETTSVHVIMEQLPTAIGLMLSRSKLPPLSDRHFWDDELAVDDAVNMRSYVKEALLQAVLALGIESYVSIVAPPLQSLQREKAASHNLEDVEAILFALASAGDSFDDKASAESNSATVLALKLALSSIHAFSSPSPQLAATAMALITNFAELLAQNDELYTDSMRTVANASLISPDSAAQALRALAEASPRKFLPHCHELLGMYTDQFDALSASASSNIAHALATAVSELPSAEERVNAITAVLVPPSKHVRALSKGPWGCSARAQLSACLATLAATLRALNEPQAGEYLLHNLAEPLGTIASSNAAEDVVVSGLCSLLDAAIAARSSDDEKQREQPNLLVVREVLNLATDSLLLSNCSEPRWLTTIANGFSSCGSSGGVEIVSEVLQRITPGVRRVLAEHGHLQFAPDLVTAYFTAMNVTLTYTPDALDRTIASVVDIALIALNSGNFRTGREVLRWWRRALLSTGTFVAAFLPIMREQLPFLIRALLLAAGGIMPQRSVAEISDVLLALLRYQQAEASLDVMISVLHSEGVPVSGLGAEEKERIASSVRAVLTRGQDRRFRVLMADISRYCRREATADVFVAYEMDV